MIDGHGDDLFRYKEKIRYNFSSNIYQGMNHAPLFRHLAEKMQVIRSYPEPEPRTLERKLGAAMGIESDNVYVAGGATEIIYSLAELYRAERSAVLYPTFSEYEDACGRYNHQISFFKDISLIPDTDMVWLCNPNNPTGDVIAPDKLMRIISERTETFFIVDQAYGKYCREVVIAPQDVVKLSNLIVLYSLTKDFSVPGLRIGYAVGSTPLMEKLRNNRIPWSVNAIALEAAEYLLEHSSDYHINLELLLSEAVRVRNAFQDLGIETTPSSTNYFLCRLPAGKASEMKDWLAENHGILIRDASNFRSLGEGCFRVAVQDSKSNDILIEAVKEWLS